MTIEATHFDGDVVWVLYTHDGKEYACITDNEDGTYTIFLPSRIDEKKRMELAYHELEHLRRGDLHARDDVERIEKRIV